MRSNRFDGTSDTPAPAPVSPAPGKVATTTRLVSRRDATPANANTPVQLAAAPAPVQLSAEEAHVAALSGVASASAPLPHQAAIQASFGHHDVSGVRAQVGGAASDASAALGARAYATGDTVAFAASPDLHLAAHEAAHVVQQRGGVRLSGGIGQAGDRYEQHADAVADLVVRGESAESLLDTMAHRGASGGSAVQSAMIQRDATPAPSASAPAAPAPAPAAPAAGAAPADPSSVPPPELLALAGKTIVDDGKFAYVIQPDGTFVVTSTPAGKELVRGRIIAPTGDFASAWQVLCAKAVGQAKVTAPPTISRGPATAAPPAAAPPAAAPPTAAPTAAPAPTTPTAGAASSTFSLGDVLESAGALLDEVVTATLSAIVSVESTKSAAKPASPGGAPPAPGGAAPAAPAPGSDAEATRATLLAAGKQDNLAIAQQLQKTLHQKYLLSPTDADDTVVTAVTQAKPELLTTINCVEFTQLTLTEAGWDLNQEHLYQGLPIAYPDRDGKLTFVRERNVINLEPESNGALLDCQAGGATKIEANSEEQKKYKYRSGEGGRTHWLSNNKNFVGMTAEQGQDFGAGAVVQSFGGIEIAPTDRKPGDMQQKLNTKDGKFTGSGHSSQVNSVRGPGICYVGGNNCAKALEVSTEGKAPGWYEIVDGQGAWEVGPDTDPAMVSTLVAKSIALIDANDDDARTQAISVGAFKKATTLSATGYSQVESSGRLPTSKWIAWPENHPVVTPIGTLTK